jgi:hypothetical protein
METENAHCHNCCARQEQKRGRYGIWQLNKVRIENDMGSITHVVCLRRQETMKAVAAPALRYDAVVDSDVPNVEGFVDRMKHYTRVGTKAAAACDLN